MNLDIHPPVVLEVADAGKGLTAWLAVDSVIEDHFCGGLRMLPDVSADELSLAATAMTLKLGFLGIPHGGAKAGIVCDQNAPREDKLRLLEAFGRGVQDLLKDRIYLPGSDMGTTNQDIRDMFKILGIPVPKRALRGSRSGWYTSLTVIASAAAASIYQGFELAGATVAIEGFGAVGSSVAQGLDRLGSKILAISTSEGSLYSPDGLDVASLLQSSPCFAGKPADSWNGAQKIDRESLLKLDVDVLFPCARHHSIRMDNVAGIKARLICPGSNAPVTKEAEETFSHRGIFCLPDFVSNAGGVLGGTMEFAGLGQSAIERFIGGIYSRQVSILIEKARQEGTYIRDFAEQVALDRFARMKGASQNHSARNRTFAFALGMYRAGMIPGNFVRVLARKFFQRRIEGKF
jgi:glutamate dehydrogenase (NAD(P)+)